MDLSLLVNYLEIFMAIFSIGTFVYAVQESRQARSEYKNALALSERYNKLVEEFQGRILDWETLIDELAKHIAAEQEGVWIAVDTLAYGSVTVPEAHKRFWSGLVSKAALGLPMEIITFNEQAQMQMLRKQFGDSVVSQPNEAMKEGLKRHSNYLQILQKQAGRSIRLFVSDYFPLHLFIFHGNGVAFLALQEITGDGKVRARAIRTHDPVMIQICRQSFIEMREFGSAQELTGSSA